MASEWEDNNAEWGDMKKKKERNINEEKKKVPSLRNITEHFVLSFFIRFPAISMPLYALSLRWHASLTINFLFFIFLIICTFSRCLQSNVFKTDCVLCCKTSKSTCISHSCQKKQPQKLSVLTNFSFIFHFTLRSRANETTKWQFCRVKSTEGVIGDVRLKNIRLANVTSEKKFSSVIHLVS